MEKINLGGLWELTSTAFENQKFEVNVPGTVLSELLRQKKIEDPYYRENEYKTRELFWNDYVYQRVVTLPQDFHIDQEYELVCEGLDTLAEIYVDDICIAKTNNMHRTYKFQFPFAADKSEYVLKIVFRSVLKYIEEYEYEEGKEIHFVSSGCMKGNQLLRKAHSMFGWDWGPQLIDAGIFREIYLQKKEKLEIDDIVITQEHRKNEIDEDEVLLHVQGILTSNRKKDFVAQVKLKISFENQVEFEHMYEVEFTTDNDSNECFIEDEILIKNPKLWWPSGYGQQPLYDVSIEVMAEHRLIEERMLKIGLRTLYISQMKDEWGEEFAFCVNGIKIFTKGGNYIPEDCMYTNITRKRQDFLLQSCVKAGFNCVRIWGGGYYPTNEFYDLCDQYGLIVWQDLMFACNVYDFTEEFEENIKIEVKEQVKRLRHHASLGMWCGNNEIESAWVNWGDFKSESKQLKADYIKQFEYVLPKEVKSTDKETFFWPSSPSSTGCFDEPDNENKGDVHYWDVWHGQKPFTEYRKHYFRFCSEFGFQSFPSLKTISTFTIEEDRNIFSKVMESHQKNDAANGKILYYLSENFRYPEGFDNLIYVTQILQGMAIKAGVDHWRQNRGRCMGSIIWQINDNWPVASWSSIDYFGRWKALHYFAKRFYAQKATSIRIDENVGSVFIENETLTKQSFQGKLQLKSMDFKILHEITLEGTVDALSSKCIVTKDFSEFLPTDEVKAEVFLTSEITFEDGIFSHETEVFTPYKYVNLKKEMPEFSVSETEDSYEITLKANVFLPFVELDFTKEDVLFSDNYVTITDTKPIIIEINKNDIYTDGLKSIADIQKKLRIRTLRDSY